MANNTVLNTGVGGDTIRDIDKGGIKTPVSAIDVGGAGTENLLTAGQQAMANSVPVVLASNQTAVPVGDNSGSLTVDSSQLPAALTGSGNLKCAVVETTVTQPVSGTVSVGNSPTVDTELTTADLDTGAGTDTRAVVGLVLAESGGGQLVGSAHPVPVSASSRPLPTGAATETTLGGVLTQSDFDTKAGSLTETAPATDTASSGLNGRLQRIAQRITSLIALLPAALSALGNFKVSLADLAGTALDTNSGNKSAGTQRVVLATDQPAVGLNSTQETSQISNAGTQLTPKFATIVASSSGVTTIVAAVTSKKIRIVSLKLVANGAVNVKWQSHVIPTDKTGLSYLAANGGEVLPFNPVGWFETIAGEALDINLSGAVAVGGHLTYVEV